MSSKTAAEASRDSGTGGAPRRPRSLATRLTWWYAISFCALLVCATGYLYWTLSASLRRQDLEFVVDEVRLLRSILSKQAEPSEALRVEVEWEWAEKQHAPVYVRILDENDHPSMETEGMQRLLPPEVFPEAIPVGREPQRLVELRLPDGMLVRAVAARAAAGPEGRAKRTIQIAVNTLREQQILASYRWRSWFLLGTAFLVSVAAGRHIAQRGLRRVREIAEAARKVRPPALDHRIDPNGLPGELSSLAHTFNNMLDRLEQSFDRQSRFSADIAHEIRTPVNNIRGEAEVALARTRSAEEYREALESCLEECMRLSRVIDALLFLGRAEKVEIPIAKERVEVGEELARVREFYEAAAAEAGVNLEISVTGRLDLQLNRTLLQRAVGNLVENALAHTLPGGTVRLAAARGPTAVTLDISDTGSGIAPEHLPHVFERFYREDRFRPAASGGVGLGLAIVRAIAELHGGRAEISSRVGQGTSVRLTFPLVADENLMAASSPR